MMESYMLSHLLQLASPMLPVGAYSYSQGLEWIIEEGSVSDVTSLENWLADVMALSLCRFELPVLKRLCDAWNTDDRTAIELWNRCFFAGRDTVESYNETLQMGYSLSRLLASLSEGNTPHTSYLSEMPAVCFPTAYACATSIWKIPVRESVHAYLWSWLENQVSVALKTIPLGQTDGQRVLMSLSKRIPNLIEQVMHLPDRAISNFTPGLSLAACQHETQYTRLFRS